GAAICRIRSTTPSRPSGSLSATSVRDRRSASIPSLRSWPVDRSLERVASRTLQAPLAIYGQRLGLNARWQTVVLLGSVLSIGLWLRLWGLSWGLPWVFHWDEINYADHAREIVRSGDPNPKYFQNPSLLTYLVVAELLLARPLGPAASVFAEGTAGSANLWTRLDSALFGTATVGLVFLLGNALFTRRTGLIAALLLAVSFLHVRNSHYGVNDVPSTALLMLSLFFAVRLFQAPAARWYLFAGLAGGLAT